MKQYLIRPEDAQKICDYLTARPFNEVYQLIPILTSLETTEVEECIPDKQKMIKPTVPLDAPAPKAKERNPAQDLRDVYKAEGAV